MKNSSHKNGASIRQPKTLKLYRYMIKRAAFEKVPFEFDVTTFERWFDAGIRLFFGVELDENGTILGDRQQREFFRRYQNAAV